MLEYREYNKEIGYFKPTIELASLFFPSTCYMLSLNSKKISCSRRNSFLSTH